LGNSGPGVTGGSSNTLIGGASIAARNIISANNPGIDLGDGSKSFVQSNFIGTDVTGTVALGNTNGAVNVNSGTNNLIGGLTATPGMPPGNLISADTGGYGVTLFTAAAAGNVIQGNYRSRYHRHTTARQPRRSSN
jgi:hypothetical protein